MSYTPPGYHPQGYPPPGYPPPGYPPPGYPPPGYPPTGYPPGQAPPGAAEPRRYSMFHGYVLFFSPKLWRDAGLRWRGIGFWFLVLLVLVAWVPTIIRWSAGYSHFLANEAPALTSQVPPITISKGVVSTPVPQPHVISDPETGKPLIVIDTTGVVTQPPAEAPSMLLTRNAIIQREGPYRMKTHDLSQIQSFYVDSESAARFLEKGKALLWVALFPAGVMYTVVWRLVVMLLMAAIASAAKGHANPLTFAGAMRLAAISMVPVVLLNAVLCPVGFSPGCWWLLIELGVPAVLFMLAVKANGPQQGAGGAWGSAPGQPWQYPAAPATAPAPWQPPPAPPGGPQA